MSFVIYLREKKGLVKGFLLFSILIFVFVLLGEAYRSFTKKEEAILAFGSCELDKKKYGEHFQMAIFLGAGTEKEAHDKVVEWLVIEEVAEKEGIRISKKEVQKEISGNGEVSEALLDQMVKNYTQKEDISDEDKEAPRKSIKEEHSFSWVVHKELLEKRFIDLCPRSLEVPYSLGDDSKRGVTWVKIADHQIKETDVFLSDEENAACRELSSYPINQDPEYREIEVIKFPVTPSQREIDEAYNSLERMREAFKEANTPKEFSHSDGKQAEEKRWKKEKAPQFIKDLEVGDVSEPTSHLLSLGDGDGAVCIYRRVEDDNNDIVTYELKAKVEKKDCLSYVQKRTEEIKNNWLEAVRKESLKPDSYQITYEIANRNNSFFLARIAKEVYCEEKSIGSTGIIENKEAGVFWVFRVGKKRNHRIPNKEDIEEKIKRQKKINKVKEALKSDKILGLSDIKNQLQGDYGDLDSEKREAVMLEDDLFSDEWSCSPKDIVTLLALKKGEHHVFWDQNSQSVVVAYITKKERSLFPYKRDIPKVLKEEASERPLKNLIEANMPNVKDCRYLL